MRHSWFVVRRRPFVEGRITLSEYKVALDVYNGPLDLLLYLIRREEVDIYDIPIARVTQQYIQYVEVLRQLDPEAVSEFLVLAATLMEIKSRTLLPRPPVEEGDEDILDPRLELVRQLLEYRRFKDAARQLEEASELQAQKQARSPVLPPRSADEVELENLDIWDLFDAFNRLLEQTGRREAVHTFGVDDTPIALHAEDILDSIERAGGTQNFEEIFTGRAKPEMIGLFLALLELMRQRRIRVSQDEPCGPILIHLLDRTPLGAVDDPNTEATEEPVETQGEESSVGTQADEADRAPVGASVDREGIPDTEREQPPVHVPPDVDVNDALQEDSNDDSQ